jgi:hypothetical protein
VWHCHGGGTLLNGALLTCQVAATPPRVARVPLWGSAWGSGEASQGHTQRSQRCDDLPTVHVAVKERQ